MAWLYQRSDSKRWWIGFRKNGRQFRLSTKTADRKAAEKKLREFELIEDAEKDGRLSREFISALTGRREAATTLASAVRDFLNEAKGCTAETTFERYAAILLKFAAHFKANEATPLLREVTSGDLRVHHGPAGRHLGVYCES